MPEYNRIKEIRNLFDYQKKQVAEGIGISVRKIEALENHREEPDEELCMKLAQFFATDSRFVQGRPVMPAMSWHYHWQFIQACPGDPDSLSGFRGAAIICFKGCEKPMCLSLCDGEWEMLKKFMTDKNRTFHFVTAFGNRVVLLNRTYIDSIRLISDDIEDNTGNHDNALPDTFRKITEELKESYFDEDSPVPEHLAEKWAKDELLALLRVSVKRNGEELEHHNPMGVEQIALMYDAYRDGQPIPDYASSIVIEHEPEYDEEIYPLESIEYVEIPAVLIENELLPMHTELWEKYEEAEKEKKEK